MNSMAFPSPYHDQQRAASSLAGGVVGDDLRHARHLHARSGFQPPRRLPARPARSRAPECPVIVVSG